MNIVRTREPRHGLLKCAALLLPVLAALACSSAPTGTAPGVAGGETLSPGITNYPLAYVKRPVPAPAVIDMLDVRDLITSNTGGDLYVRSQASADGTEVNITNSLTNGQGDVRDLDVSPDGTTVVFSLRLPLMPNVANTDPTQPNWHIYTYNAVTNAVTQLTNDEITSGHDVGAHYLPDGRIVFSSSRQLATQAILLDEGRPQYQAILASGSIPPQPIFLLHVMNGDGSNMHQISFNTNHDFAPSVLSSGQVVFTRWETVNGADQMSLYVTNPDGTELQLYYGANSHATGANIAGTNNNLIQFLNARQRSDGKLIAIDRPYLGTQLGGDTLLINAQQFVEINQSASPTPVTGTGQASATPLGVTTDANVPSPGGRFASAYPLYDGTNRMLVSWSPCLVTVGTATEVCSSSNSTGANVVEAPPQYTLWVYDFDAGTLSPLLSAETGLMIVEPVILQKRTPPATDIPDSIPTAAAAVNMAANGVGLLQISSVYDFAGVDTATPDIADQANPSQPSYYNRPNRFIRVEHAVEIPPKSVRKINQSAFGPAGMGMREILGYAPIQPDGSVQIQVPAYIPFTIEILDQYARRVTTQQHTSWMQVMPGETKSCNGCHSSTANVSHGRSGLSLPVNHGAPTTGLPFPSTNPNLFAIAGETMAQTLGRISCAQGSALTCSQILSTDVIYTNIWTVDTTPPQPDTGISYLYSELSTPSPILADAGNCAPWGAYCRDTIEYFPNSPPLYVGQLQPIWNLTPRTATVAGVANTSVTCTLCHNTLNAAMTAQQVPSGQVDLTGGTSSVDTTVVTSYEQLLFPHDEQTLNMGILETYLVTDPGPPPTQVPVVLGGPITAGSALDSTAFFSVFAAGGSHNGWLTPAELRLISEWIDIGGQYYNDPFVAPVAN
jgi:Hydrazine synthase alpha subunit middle domain